MDIAIAGVLLVIALVTVVISKMGLLPKKLLPYLAVGLGTAFTIAWLRRWGLNRHSDDAKKQEEALAEQEGRLAQAQPGLAATDQQLAQARAALEARRAALAKDSLLINATSAEDKKKIDALQGEELFAKYREQFGGQAPTGGGGGGDGH